MPGWATSKDEPTNNRGGRERSAALAALVFLLPRTRGDVFVYHDAGPRIRVDVDDEGETAADPGERTRRLFHWSWTSLACTWFGGKPGPRRAVWRRQPDAVGEASHT